MGIIQKLLNKSDGSAIKDKCIFERYKLGEIDIEQCLSGFYENNKVRNEDQILTKAMFEEWLNDLGYRKIKE